MLSFLIPGLGQVYKGQIGLGILLFGVTLIGYVMLIVPGLIVHFCVILDAYSGDGTSAKTVVTHEVDDDEPLFTAEETETRKVSSRKQNRQIVVVTLLVVVVAIAIAIFTS